MDPKQIIATATEAARDIFKLDPPNVIGVDIGLSTVKVAEVIKLANGNFKLIKYAAIALPEGSLIEDDIQKEEEIIEAIQDAFREAGISNPNVCIGLSGPNTLARKLQLPGGSLEEIEDNVMWEVEQYLPFSIEDSMVSFDVMRENEGGGVEVLVAGAKVNIVENFKDLIDKAGYRVKIVDMDLIAMTNVFEHLTDGQLETENTWLLVDFGAQKTNFVIYKKGGIVFTKEMNIGGVIVTEEIQRQMGVNYIEAEELKIIGDENGNLPEEILEIIGDVLDAFFSEIKKTLDFYITQTSDESIQGCLVTGGTCLLPGLIDGLEELTGIEVSVLNPFERIEFDKRKFNEDDINSIAYTGVVALGLGMRSSRE